MRTGNAKRVLFLVDLLEIPIPNKHLSIYDFADEMLSMTKEQVLDRAMNDIEGSMR